MTLTVKRTFVVDRPSKFVYDYLSDFTNTEQWDPGTISTTRLGVGAIGLGARFHNVSEFLGRRTELDYVLTRAEPWQRLVFTGNNKTVTSHDDLRLEAVGDGTSITYLACFDFHGLARLAAPFLKPGFERLADKTVEQMRQTIELTVRSGA